jgi:hypothetical protein
VVFADQAQKDVFLRVYEADGTARFERPVNVSKSPGVFSWLPRVLMIDGGNLCVLWQEIVFSGGSHGGEAFFARSADGGRTFGVPVNLSNSTAGDGKGRLTRSNWHNGSLALARGPKAELYAVWTEYEGALWFSRSTDGGEHFDEPRRIAGDGRAPARGPSLGVDGKGTIYVAWTIGEDAAADIRVTRSLTGSATFKEPRIVAKSEAHADAPKLSVDSKGSVHLVYAESQTGPRGRYRILYTRSTDGALGFQRPKEISGEHGRQFASVSFPHLASDGSDNLYVVWEMFAEPSGSSQGLGFSRSSDGGRTFSPPSVIPGTLEPALGFNGSQQGLLMSKLAVSHGGVIAAVNSTFKPNEASYIWLLRGRLKR